MDQQILQAVDSIEPRLWWFFIKLGMVAILGLLSKTFIENIVAYIMFRINKNIGRNTRVIINKKEGYISYFDLQFIYIKFKDHNEMLIPISKWKNNNWEIIDVEKNGGEKK